MIEVSLSWLKFNSFSETFNCIIIIPFSVKTYSFIIIRESIILVYLYGLGIINYCSFKLPYFVIGKSTVEEGFKMSWDYFKSFRVKFNGSLIISFFPSCIPLRMKMFCLLLFLLKFQGH